MPGNKGIYVTSISAIYQIFRSTQAYSPRTGTEIVFTFRIICVVCLNAVIDWNYKIF